jgi:hypothetical protein
MGRNYIETRLAKIGGRRDCLKFPTSLIKHWYPLHMPFFKYLRVPKSPQEFFLHVTRLIIIGQ